MPPLSSDCRLVSTVAMPEEEEVEALKGQPTLWPIDEVYGELTIPDDYPWRYHQLLEGYKAEGFHPSVAAVMAEQKVANEKAAEERKLRRLKPTLFDEQAQAEQLRKNRPRLHVA